MLYIRRSLTGFIGLNLKINKLALVRDMFVLQVWFWEVYERSIFINFQNKIFIKTQMVLKKVWFTQHKTDDEVMNTVNQNYLAYNI